MNVDERLRHRNTLNLLGTDRFFESRLENRAEWADARCHAETSTASKACSFCGAVSIAPSVDRSRWFG